MTKNILRLATMMTVLLSAAALFAQNGAPPSNGNPPPRGRQEPCWLQAGISRSVMEQRQTIERDAHSQVEAVCENSSLTPQQKQQQVREIRRQAQEKVEALVTPEQQSAINACRQQRGMRTANEGHHPGGAGPAETSRQPRDGKAPRMATRAETPRPHRINSAEDLARLQD